MTAEYPGAIWMPAHPSNFKRGRSVVAADLVTCHCTDGHEHAKSVADMFAENLKAKGEAPRSAHFVIGQAGEIYQCVSIADTAYHAHSANGRSVGIEHCARTPKELGPNDLGLPPSLSLYESSAKLVAWLCETLSINPSRVSIVGHAEADPKTTHRLCPTGCGWDWARYMAMVSAAWEARKVA